ncbi:MAG TPA: serine/threonine-protein kinase [Kofleriaceae bacterium]|nr:serine/threonine-protein kinase [Kofleriaceae bacterium]
MAAAVANPDAVLQRASDPANALTRRRGRPDDGLTAGSRVSSWKVDSELGRGGMSSVHAVVHTKFGKRAAIKIAHRSVLGDGGLSAQTFWREARIVHTVEHPAVIDVFATGSHDGRPYLVMEKLIGEPLGRRVDHGPPMPRREAIQILLELCDVLRTAHAAGLVHRDLKLDNVFLCDTLFAGGRRVKLLDWGVAYVEGEPDPFRGQIAGTLTYVAPEQIRGDGLTGAADIYSLAVLAYHLLCRRPPFAGSDLALLNMHLRAEPPPPRFAWPDVPPALDDLLVRMLAKQPGDRPSLDEVEDTLQAAFAVVDQPPRLAEGSNPNIRLPAEEPWYLRWLMVREGDVQSDVLGRPIVVPPFRPAWMAIGLTISALATLISALT